MAKPKLTDKREHPLYLKNNLATLYFLRTYVSIIVGAAVGLMGVAGLYGFIYHAASQLLCVLPLAFKCGLNAPAYFRSWSNFMFFNAFSSTTLLSYVLFWMIFYNLAHVF